ncbi:hypothetical protein GGX14DRAFT_408783 [Mycena pura]|uniref:Uncharacterized protein n=1 Tax=Mycena pura TaxID=153505 RepID=A0AAD6USE0_9AGAR|nr:hypothetical protein GGX14DRAFT_408783 [Mycena pura]
MSSVWLIRELFGWGHWTWRWGNWKAQLPFRICPHEPNVSCSTRTIRQPRISPRASEYSQRGFGGADVRPLGKVTGSGKPVGFSGRVDRVRVAGWHFYKPETRGFLLGTVWDWHWMSLTSDAYVVTILHRVQRIPYSNSQRCEKVDYQDWSLYQPRRAPSMVINRRYTINESIQLEASWRINEGSRARYHVTAWGTQAHGVEVRIQANVVRDTCAVRRSAITQKKSTNAWAWYSSSTLTKCVLGTFWASLIARAAHWLCTRV